MIYFDTLRPGQNGRHFADKIFKYISVNAYVCIDLNFTEVCSIDKASISTGFVMGFRPQCVSTFKTYCSQALYVDGLAQDCGNFSVLALRP